MAGTWRGWAGVTAVALGIFLLSGCALLGLMGMKNKRPAAFTFPKGHHVLVLVDLGSGVAAPPDFTTTFADDIGRRLWQNKVVDTPLISQDRVIPLRQSDPNFGRMKVGDVAAAVHADNVLEVQVTRLATISPDGLVADGAAEVRLWVFDKDGNHIWPADGKGEVLSASVNMGLLSDRGIPEIVKLLTEKLTVQIDAEFHVTEEEHHVGQ